LHRDERRGNDGIKMKGMRRGYDGREKV